MAFFTVKFKLPNYELLSKQWLAPCILVKVIGDVSRFPGNAFRKTSDRALDKSDLGKIETFHLMERIM